MKNIINNKIFRTPFLKLKNLVLLFIIRDLKLNKVYNISNRNNIYLPIKQTKFFVFLFFALLLTLNTQAQTPIHIRYIDQLDSIRTNSTNYPLNGNYILDSNLDFTKAASYSNGIVNNAQLVYPGWVPIGGAGVGFSGTFDGNNKTIYNCYMRRAHGSNTINQTFPGGTNTFKPTETNFTNNTVGFFGKITSTGTVKNLSLKNMEMLGDGNINSPSYFVLTAGGLFVGTNEGKIDNCFVSGIANINSGSYRANYIGGFVGGNKGTITNSGDSIQVILGSLSNIENNIGHFGGFVLANLSGSKIINCFSVTSNAGAPTPGSGNLNGVPDYSFTPGGFVWAEFSDNPLTDRSTDSIINCYSTNENLSFAGSGNYYASGTTSRFINCYTTSSQLETINIKLGISHSATNVKDTATGGVYNASGTYNPSGAYKFIRGYLPLLYYTGSTTTILPNQIDTLNELYFKNNFGQKLQQQQYNQIYDYRTSKTKSIVAPRGTDFDSLFVNNKGSKVTGRDSIKSIVLTNVDPKKRIQFNLKLDTQLFSTSFVTFKNSTQIYDRVDGIIAATSSAPAGQVYYDSNLFLTLTANAGFKIDSLIVDGVKRPLTTLEAVSETLSSTQSILKATYTVPGVTTNLNIALYLSYRKFIIRTAAYNGSINGSINRDSVVFYDSSFVYTFSANPGFKLNSVEINSDFLNVLKLARGRDTITSIREDKRVNATITKIEYPIKISAPNGSITTSGSGINTETRNVYYDSTVNFSYSANNGYRLDSLLVNRVKRTIISGARSGTDTVNRVKYIDTVRLNLYTTKIAYNITTIAVNGRITPSGTRAYDSSFIVIYSADTGYKIDSILLGSTKKTFTNTTLSGTDTIKIITRDSTIKLYCSKLKYNITSRTYNATITPAVGSVFYDSNFIFTYSANTGYQIREVSVGNDLLPNTSKTGRTDTLKRVKSDKYIEIRTDTAQFTIKTIAYKGTISDGGTRVYNSSFIVNYKADTGYKIDSILLGATKKHFTNNTLIGTDTIKRITSDSTIIVYCSKLKYRITTLVTANARVSPSVVDAYYDSNYVITYSAYDGYQIYSIVVGNIQLDESIIKRGFDTVKRVRSDLSFDVFARRAEFSITTSANNGLITPSGTRYYDSNFVVTFSANTGYKIDSLVINGQRQNIIPGIKSGTDTLKAIRSNHTVTLYTSRILYTITSNFVNSTHGTINSGNALYTDSFVVRYTVNAAYKIDSIFVGRTKLPTSFNTSTNYTIRNITSDTIFKIYTSLAPITQFTITTSITSGTITQSSRLDSGTNFIVTYSATDGYKIDSISLGATKKYFINNITSGTDTIKGVQSSQTVTVFTSRKILTIQATIQNRIITSPVDYGSSYRLTYGVPVGSTIDSFVINDSNYIRGRDSLTGYTFNNITSNQTVRIVISITPTPTMLNVVAIIQDRASTETVPYGSNYRFTYTIPIGYKIDSINLNKVYQPTGKDSTTGFTLYNIIKNDTLSIIINILTFPILASHTGALLPTKE